MTTKRDCTGYASLDPELYNPNAERDARIKSEGLYSDSFHQLTTFNVDEDELKVKSAPVEFRSI